MGVEHDSSLKRYMRESQDFRWQVRIPEIDIFSTGIVGKFLPDTSFEENLMLFQMNYHNILLCMNDNKGELFRLVTLKLVTKLICSYVPFEAEVYGYEDFFIFT